MKMQEINNGGGYGGFIEFEYFYGKEYHENVTSVNSGRHALEYLIRAKKIGEVLLPYFMCNTVKAICDKLKVQTKYYKIDEDLLPVYDKRLENNSYIYIVNYYGQLTGKKIAELKSKYNNIIIDNAQAFFDKPIKGIDTLYTCRKFFGVADGGYVYTDAKLTEALERDLSFDKMQFLFGRLEKTASEFYKDNVYNNDRFDNEELKLMSKSTQNILRGIDYKRVEKVRTENFKTYHKAFKDANKLSLKTPKGAFAYPLFIDDGEMLKKKLIENKIYIPTLWPDVFEVCKEGDLEYRLAKNVLPLPVDQRYGKEDIEFIIRTIKQIKGVSL